MSNETSMCSCEHARKWHTCGVGPCSQCGCNRYDGPTDELTSDQMEAITAHVVAAMKGQLIANPSANELCDVTGTWWVRKDVSEERVRHAADRAKRAEAGWDASCIETRMLTARAEAAESRLKELEEMARALYAHVEAVVRPR